MYTFFASLIILASPIKVFGKESLRIRGVSSSMHSLYTTNSFTCHDGRKSISSIQVNDDFCDCADSSDEPGTAACPSGQFYCSNFGHRSKNIPSSRVNDGICDCCDGSDEYASNSLCFNACAVLGQKEQEQLETLKTLIENSVVLRDELIRKGKEVKAKRLYRLSELQHKKLEHEVLKAEKEELKMQAEALELEALEQYKQIEAGDTVSNSLDAQEVFLKYDLNGDGFIEATELQNDISLDRDRNGIVTLEEANFFLNEGAGVDLNSFVELSWPRIKPQLMLIKNNFNPSEFESQEDQVNLEESEDVYDSGEDTGEGSVSKNSNKLNYDPETRRIIELASEARNTFFEIEREIRDINNEIKDIENKNMIDYGVHEEYSTLDGQCFTYEDREYIYNLCPFDRASQKQRNGGSETTLGRWDRWFGSEINKYELMKYSQGASCWNGPQRSAVVQLKCALEHKILSVTEPSRCEYLFIFETPAHCTELPSGGYYQLHDEL